MRPRYVARSLGWDTRELTEDATFPDGSPIEPYGLWDTMRQCWVDRWGEPDDEYWAASADVAKMRARGLRGMLAESH